jgi:hypothetical protein
MSGEPAVIANSKFQTAAQFNPQDPKKLKSFQDRKVGNTRLPIPRNTDFDRYLIGKMRHEGRWWIVIARLHMHVCK